MESSLVSSSRPEAFPVGLRVLVVDDDPTWLKILEKMLKKCSYEVITCGLARVALDLLLGRREKFDIVISDVNMPDMDGFKLLEHVGLEMDLPVIMMSVDGETSRVMKGVQHGACDYLLKPIRMKELRNIWQHVYRKRIHEFKEIEGQDISEELLMMRNAVDDFDDRQLFGGAEFNAPRKRKEMDGKEGSDQELSDTSSVKKARVVWSVDLHQKFVNAVNQIGFDKVGPKKILDLMNIPGLTRENVASHLQKYRLYLSRLQKQNEGKGYGGNLKADFSPKETQTSFGINNSIATNQNNAASGYVPTSRTTQIHEKVPSIPINGVKSTISLDVNNPQEAIPTDVSSTRKANSVPPLGVVLSFKGTMSNAEYESIEPSISKHQAWSGGIPIMQFMQYPKHDHEPYSLLEDYLTLPLTRQLCQTSSGQLHNPPSIISKACNAEKDKTVLTQIKPVFTDYRTCHAKSISPLTCMIDSVSVQVERGVVTSQDFGAKYEANISSSKKNGTDLASIPEDLQLRSFQNGGCFENIGLNGADFLQYNDSTSLTEFDTNWYDGFEVNYEYLYDPVDYPVIDDCLFA